MRADIRQLRLVLLLSGVLLIVGGVVAGAIIQRSQSSLDQTLRMEAEEHAGAVRDYFGRARDVTLVSAQNPAFQRFYRVPGTLAEKVRDQPELMREVAAALRYLHVLYPGRIGAACFIDGGGHENARVVRGEVAGVADLSPDESANPFFKPTMALRPGQVFHARPYSSPDARQWVISSSTLVPNLPSGDAAIVHFEVTVESMRQVTEPDDPRYTLQIIDRLTGQVITDSRYPQRVDAPLGRPADRAVTAALAAEHGDEGMLTVGTERVAYTRVTAPAGGKPTTESAVNANDWVLVVAATAPSGIWSGPFTAGPISLVLIGVLALLLGARGYHRQHRQLYERARVDDLTGLPNRLALREALAELIDDGTRGAVLLLDLDRFKVINDTLGHQAGDVLLVEVAHRLRRVLAAGQNLVARLGGDEFVVLLRNTSDDEAAIRMAGVLQKAVRETMTLEGIEVTIATSIGIALVPRHGDTYGQLLRRADLAMYQAKRSGNDHRVYRPDLDGHSQAKLGMEVALLNAIERDEFVLHYQPSIQLVSGDTRRVEALVRWDRPDLGLIPPATFLPVAEELGLMPRLTRQILGAALDQCGQWRAEGLDIEVAVNLSAENCTDTALPGDIATMLEARALPPAVLWLEITEHAAIAPEARAVLARLRRMGVRLALDDFGTGFSSLSYVGSLPIDEIKIDRSFVAAIERDPTDMVIVRAAIAMAHGLGQSVTAEGAESAQSVQVLAELGVDAIQGYHYCRPLPPAELRRWLLLRHPRGRAIAADPDTGHDLAPTRRAR